MIFPPHSCQKRRGWKIFHIVVILDFNLEIPELPATAPSMAVCRFFAHSIKLTIEDQFVLNTGFMERTESELPLYKRATRKGLCTT
jgi:hypothetical protein